MADDLAAILPLSSTSADAAFVPLAGEAPLVRVARTMCGAAVVAAAEPLADRARETLAAEGLSTISVVTAAKPGSRAQCVAAALESFAHRSPHVLIHDIRRPLAPVRVRDRVIDGLRAGGSVVMPMLALTDSVKTVDARGAVTGTLDRSLLRTVQYPRGFTADQLNRLLATDTTDDFDELDAALRTDTPLTLVDGDPDAFVVELPRDAHYVEAIIACRLE
ncbi:2-C-methyl-D-erythritol 4-phosphate cytidylyltransferase [Mycobacterium sp. NPDC048908]|uniref:IspD/TarI family cytidylyltransferase n=1 Tax=Mycobacterium sp. NPDC048908 TaxID=3364292 RepID=UPI00371BBCCD